MVDVHDSGTRSKNMRAIRHQDTGIEKTLLQLLLLLEIPVRQQARDLPGRPDFVLEGARKVIFTHGCFWHQHHCRLYKPPATRRDFWLEKIGRNVVRDRENIRKLQAQGWKVLIVWECAIKGKTRLSHQQLSERVEEWICASEGSAQITDQGISQLTEAVIPPAEG